MICIDHMTRLSTTEHKNNNKKRRQNEKMHNCSVLWNKFTFGALLKRNQWLFNLEEHNDTNLDVKTQRTTPPPAPPPKSLKNSHAGIPTFSMAHQPDQNGKQRGSSICGSLLKRKKQQQQNKQQKNKRSGRNVDVPDGQRAGFSAWTAHVWHQDARMFKKRERWLKFRI